MNAQRASTEAAKYRRRLRDEEAKCHQLARANRELRRLLIQALEGGKFADFNDFDTFIGVDAVTRSDGLIDWSHLGVRIDDLFTRKPHLMASVES